eukprot:jgi/Bigna1/74191/fgenesh1_pg.28_\
MGDQHSPGTEVRVGNLEASTDKRGLEEFFRGSGKITSVRITNAPDHAGLVTFENVNDAKNAVAALNGKEFRGNKLSISFTKASVDVHVNYNRNSLKAGKATGIGRKVKATSGMSFARNTDATIGELKKQIVENEDIPEQIAGRIVLRPYTAKRADKALAEDVRLGDLCNEGRTKLLLRADISGTEIKQYGMEDYKLKIKGLSGATIGQPLGPKEGGGEIGASHTDLVYMVKRKIEKMEGLSVNSQRLVFAGKGLEDLRTLRDYSDEHLTDNTHQWFSLVFAVEAVSI